MTGYQLALSETELRRYAMMAQRALLTERVDWERAGIVTGAIVADVGCGPAAITTVLAELVGPTGRVVGVERDPVALSHAATAVERSGARNVELREGAADDTGLEPGSFDVVMLRHVLAHNGGGEQRIVDHLVGLVRPGGAVFLVDAVLVMMRMVPEDPDLAGLSQRYADFHTSLGNDPAVGLRLGSLLETAGLVLEHHAGGAIVAPLTVGVRPPSFAARDAMLAAGFASAVEVDAWERAFARIDEMVDRPRFYAPTFTACARKPHLRSQ